MDDSEELLKDNKIDYNEMPVPIGREGVKQVKSDQFIGGGGKPEDVGPHKELAANNEQLKD
jgi:hypothetical protein